MTLIRDLLAGGRTVSFEFFPPKTDEAERQLEKAIRELEPLHPSFVSVTYGAGGSTRERTRDIVIGIERDTALTAMAHLTCVGHTRSEVVSLLEEYRVGGVQNILALAGDPPTDGSDPAGDFQYAIDLVELVRQVDGFSVGVAAHPEGHPRSPDLVSDRRHLAAKLGVADFAITQFFFRAEDHLRMVDDLASTRVRQAGDPGDHAGDQCSAGAALRRAVRRRVPARSRVSLRGRGRRRSGRASHRCRGGDRAVPATARRGVPGLHFYTLNRSTATREIAANLGL
jgi:methylenetetrahydrofolate reductase (NADPH)